MGDLNDEDMYRDVEIGNRRANLAHRTNAGNVRPVNRRDIWLVVTEQQSVTEMGARFIVEN